MSEISICFCENSHFISMTDDEEIQDKMPLIKTHVKVILMLEVICNCIVFYLFWEIL